MWVYGILIIFLSEVFTVIASMIGYAASEDTRTSLSFPIFFPVESITGFLINSLRYKAFTSLLIIFMEFLLITYRLWGITPSLMRSITIISVKSSTPSTERILLLTMLLSSSKL